MIWGVGTITQINICVKNLAEADLSHTRWLPISEFSTQKIQDALTTKTLGRRLAIVNTCTSTSDIAEHFALAGAPNGMTVIAVQQSHGRGRFGRSWCSPPGGLWMTIVLRYPEFPVFAAEIPLLGALSIARTLNSMFGIHSLVKWPNDVVIRSNKVAGTIAQSRFDGNNFLFTLLGIGVNANFQRSLIRDANPNSTTILDELNDQVDINHVASSVLNEIEIIFSLAAQNQTDHILELLSATDYSRGRRVKVTIPPHTVEGRFRKYRSLSEVEIDKDGEYVIVEQGKATGVEYID